MNLNIGDRVRHPHRPEWGPGEVLAALPDGKVTIYFALVGQKTLKGVAFEPLTGPAAEHPLLEHRIRAEHRGKKHRAIADLKAVFLHRFPGGFTDPEYLAEERNYKLDAAQHLTRTMDARTLHQLIDEKNYPEMCKRALSVIGKTNLVFPNEQIKLRAGITTPTHQEAFATTLTQLLYDVTPYQKRFETFAGVLAELGAAKWTIATYFPFLAHPAEHMYLKPDVTKKAALACDFELHYDPQPNWTTYEALLKLCQTLKTVIADLAPRDMIDLQSFIWKVGNRG